MITNIRTGKEYFQQTDISLMYASRAKKVRNRSLVNRNVIGDTGIHAVTSEIERLKCVIFRNALLETTVSDDEYFNSPLPGKAWKIDLRSSIS
jgi:hypothetical protein